MQVVQTDKFQSTRISITRIAKNLDCKDGGIQMEKEFQILTYSTGKGSVFRLRLDSDHSWINPKNVEIKARVNLESGEVSLFIEGEDLEILKKQIQKNTK